MSEVFKYPILKMSKAIFCFLAQTQNPKDETGDCDHTAAHTYCRLRPVQLRLLYCLVLFWNILNDLTIALLLLSDISGFRAICRYEKMQTSCFTPGSSGVTVAVLLAVPGHWDQLYACALLQSRVIPQVSKL